MNKSELEKIVEKFLEYFLSKYSEVEIEGVLVFGSALREKYFFEHSDVDIYVVIKNNGKRYRGIKIVDGIEVDYFVNPIEQLQKDFENVAKISASAGMTVLFMLADGRIFQDKDEQLNNLQKKAKRIIEEGVSEMTKYQIHMAKYFINDYLKDIKDAEDDFVWQRNVDLLLNYLVETTCAFYSVHITKAKYQKMELEKIDNEFVQLYEKVAQSQNKQRKQGSIEALAKHVINKLGGELKTEWEITTNL